MSKTKIKFGPREVSEYKDEGAWWPIAQDGTIVGEIQSIMQSEFQCRTGSCAVSGYEVELWDGEAKEFTVADGENARTVLARAKAWAREQLTS